MRFHSFLHLAASLALLLPAQATPPFWWRQGDPPVLDPSASPNNKAATNIGQAKWMAKSALEALRRVRPDLATDVETALVGTNNPIASWDLHEPGSPEALAHRAPLLIGHLKSIADPFYTVLHGAEPVWLEGQLVANQTKDPADPANYFPWTSATGDDANKAAVSIGQLKSVFSLKFSEMDPPGAVRTGFDGIDFARNDDETYPFPAGPPTEVPIGFSVNFYGETFSDCFVNNNGNITFEGPLSTFTPEPFGDFAAKIIAAFWADVDTRGAGSEITRFTAGGETIGGRPAFGVTYRDVGYFRERFDKLNLFQLILIDRSDIAAGDFDIEYNYDRVLWETGSHSSSGGVDGLGGNSVRVGLGNGEGHYLEYQNSGVNSALLDFDPITEDPNLLTGLIYQAYNTTQPGRIVIPFRGGFPQGNHNLIVNAGTDVTLAANHGASFQLQGSVSPTSGVTHEWTIVSGPYGADISDPAALTPTVSITETGVYVFKLSATKPGVITEFASDTVTITHPGVFEVAAGTYQRTSPASKTVILDQAVASFSGNAVPVQWIQVGGPAASISNATVVQPSVTLPGYGDYYFEITATTNTSPPFVKTALAQVSYHYAMSAGTDITLGANDNGVFTLNGTATSAPNTSISWSRISGPGSANIANPSALSTQVTLDQPGVHVFGLSIIGPDITTSDTVTVTHPATFNVSAGSYYPTQSPGLILNQAVATFSNGPVTVQWAQIYGDAAVITNPTAVQPSVTLPAPGYYQFQITASTGHTPPFVKTAEVTVYYSE